MKVFKVEILMNRKIVFEEKGLYDIIEKNLKEVDLKLMKISYIGNTCTCIAEFKELQGIPYHQYTLGCFMSLPNEYPHADVFGINPSFVDIE